MAFLSEAAVEQALLDQLRTLDIPNRFAILYLGSHRYPEGAKILQDLLPTCERIYGPEHGFTISVVANLAGALRQQGTAEKIAASGAYYRRALEGTRKRYGAKHPNMIVATHNYANYLLDTGDATQAATLQRQALQTALEVYGADHAVTGEIHFGLGKALLRLRRYAEAEQELLAAITEKQKYLGVEHWRMGEYIAPLIEAYRADDQPSRAAEWEARRANLKSKTER
jgi:tetratricopeptide (TPR) repeat protein